MTSLSGPRLAQAAPGAPRQLAVICHGVGANGQDLIAVGPLLAAALPHAVFAAPDGPQPYDMSQDPGQPESGRQWFSLKDWRPDAMAAGVRAASESLGRYIDETLAELGIPPTEYALAGFSQGAMMALFTGLRRPIPPRAILAYSGMLLAPDELRDEMTGRPRVLLVHGEEDEVVPSEASCVAADVLESLGVPVELRLRQGLGHDIDPEDLAAGGRLLREVFPDTVPAEAAG